MTIPTRITLHQMNDPFGPIRPSVLASTLLSNKTSQSHDVITFGSVDVSYNGWVTGTNHVHPEIFDAVICLTKQNSLSSGFLSALGQSFLAQKYTIIAKNKVSWQQNTKRFNACALFISDWKRISFWRRHYWERIFHVVTRFRQTTSFSLVTVSTDCLSLQILIRSQFLSRFTHSKSGWSIVQILVEVSG